MKFEYVKNLFFWVLLTTITLIFFWMIKSFFSPIFWAIVLGIVFYPIYKIILNFTKNKKAISSLLSIILIFLFIFVPLFFVAKAVVGETGNFYQSFITQDQEIYKYFDIVTEKAKIIGINELELKETITSVFKSIVFFIKDQALIAGKYTLQGALMFFLMLYLLFFIFKDGERLLRYLSRTLPLGDKRENLLFKKFVITVRAIFKGTILIALIQGILGGALFYLVGIEAIFLWTVVMVILAIIPAVGPAFLLVPAGIIFILAGSLGFGILLLAGATGISILDNILRPLLVSKDLKIHDALITLSIFGGLVIFGMNGLIIGPVILVLFLLFWDFFREEYREELKNNE